MSDYDSSSEGSTDCIDFEQIDAGDSAPFIPDWGLSMTDTVIGNAENAMKWSKYSVTPADEASIVTKMDTEQIRSLGSQALATANIYFNAALHRITSSETKLELAEKEVTHLKNDIKTWADKYRALEVKLIEAKATVARMEIDEAKYREQVIADYIKSPEFKAVLDREVYRLCWAKAIAAVKEVYSQVDATLVPCPLDVSAPPIHPPSVP